MAIQHPDIQPAVNHSVQVAIAGAGPVGLMMANYLGQMGIDVLVVEKLDKLIDYPRAIGIDDEALRTMQSVGLVENVLPRRSKGNRISRAWGHRSRVRSSQYARRALAVNE